MGDGTAGTASRLGRPRQVEDEAVFAAMGRVLLRTGWARMTVSRIAAELGITPAALRQRFGAKHELFAAFYAWHTERLKAEAALPPDGDGSALDALFAEARASVAFIETPDQMRNAMSPMAEIGETPGMRRMTEERLAAALERMTALLERARDRGEISRADPAALARQLRNCLLGTSMAWSVAGGRPITDEVTETVEQVLAPYRHPQKGTSNR